jgi:hypothetical protein
MGEASSELSFERAEYTSGDSASAPCANCRQPLREQYWKWQSQLVCDGCRGKVAETLARSQSGAAFRKALLVGGGTALACGVAYAVFVGVTKVQFALATIGIAFAIARVVRKASGGISGRRFQVLAVALTYVASSMGYLPGIIQGIRETPAKHAASQAETPSSPSEPNAAPAPGEKHKASLLDLFMALGMLFGIMLAAPFLEITEAPIGVLIVAFGLWEAWKLPRGIPIRIEGPYRVAPSTGPPVA